MFSSKVLLALPIISICYAGAVRAEDVPAAPSAPVAVCITQASVDESQSALKADPAAFIAQFADGGGGLIRSVRAVVATDPSSAATILKALTGTSDKQAFSVGVGMGQAAAACTKGNPEAAAAIQQAVAMSGNPSALAGFSQAFGNLLVASTGGGNGGGGSLPSGTNSALGTGFDGGGGGSNAGASTDMTVSAPNTSGNFLTGTIGGSNQRRTRLLVVAVSPSTP